MKLASTPLFLASLMLSTLLSTSHSIDGAPKKKESLVPPEPPYVKKVPSTAHWKMTFKKKQNQNDASTSGSPPTSDSNEFIKSIEFRQKGRLRQIIIIDSKGKKIEQWQKSRFLITPMKNGELTVIPASSAAYREYLSKNSNFHGVSWVKAEYFTGIKKKKKKRYHHYTKSFKPNAPFSDEQLKDMGIEITDSTTYEKKVLIDSKTRLPFQIEDDFVTITYQFFESPVSLNLPLAYLNVWDKRENALKRLNAKFKR